MSGRSIRLGKEARQILGPWSLMMLAALLVLWRYQGWSDGSLFHIFLSWIFPLGVAFGLPILASLPLGHEFQYRTLPLLLSEPTERGVVWLDKQMIAFAAVIPPAVIFLISARTRGATDPGGWVTMAAWIIGMSAASTVWTLVARSTLGGIALNAGSHFLTFIGWAYLANHLRIDDHFPTWLLRTTVVAFVLYAAAMIWLGRRLFLRYQVADGIASSDAVADPLAHLVPRAIAESFRSRPLGATRNLIRREMYLLRPVWMLTAFALIGWIALVALHQLPTRKGDVPIVFVLTVMISPIVAVLAGALSQGEERNLGTHEWHMTMPISLRKQWAVKLLVAVCASLLCAGVLPVAMLLIAGRLAGSPYIYLGHGDLWIWPVNLTAIAVLAFWCSCAVKGTVRAALCVFPVLLALGAAGQLGAWTGDFVSSRVLPLSTVTSWINPFPLNHSLSAGSLLQIWPPLWYAPVALVILIQSYSLFRGDASHTISSFGRRLLPAIVAVFLCSVALATAFQFARATWHERTIVLREMGDAIATLEAKSLLGNPAGARTLQPVQYTVEQLAAASPLSASTRRWLESSTIVVTPKDGLYCTNCAKAFRSGFEPGSYMNYNVEVTLHNGLRCRLILLSANGRAGALGTSCEDPN